MAKDEMIKAKEKNEETSNPKSKTPSSFDFSVTSKESQTIGTPTKKKYSSLCTPTTAFWGIAKAKEEVSRCLVSPVKQSLRGKITKLAYRIDWRAWMNTCIEWFKNPMNIAFFIWLVSVIVTCSILFLIMTGLLDIALPKKSQRDDWSEVTNQIINAQFTLLCLYQHPQKIYDLFLLLRWKPEDISKLRITYCKNGTYKPREWAHMLVVVILLHLYCITQYVLCGLQLGYSRSNRSALGVAICVAVEIAAVVAAGIYSILSPLGKEYAYDVPVDEESQMPIDARSPSISSTSSISLSFAKQEDENQPHWKGGIFSLCDDISVSSLSLFFNFCVFGWNMDRLGFGNMYVHIITFILFCSAPFFVFNLAALNMDDEALRKAIGISGCLLCAFGLLYGGYWRIKMRKRYNLPPYTFCCGKPDASDCTLWFFFWWCSLSQEVRTANFYEIVEEKFCTKKDDENVDQQSSDLPSEDGGMICNNINSEPSPVVIPSDHSRISTKDPSVGREDEEQPQQEEGGGRGGGGSREGTSSKPMTPPSPLIIKK